MADLVIGQTPIATVKWFNSAGREVIPSVDSAWASSNPADLQAISSGLETAQLDALAPGSVNLTATDPTSGVVATLAVVIVDLPIDHGVITLS